MGIRHTRRIARTGRPIPGKANLIFYAKTPGMVDSIGLSISELYPLVDPALRAIISADGGTTKRADADIVTAALASPLLNSSSMVGSEDEGIAFYAYLTTPFTTLSRAARYLKGTWVAPSGPNAFTLTDTTGAELSTITESSAITVAGLDVAVWFSVTGGEARVNSGSWLTSGVVVNTDTVKVRRTSSADYVTAVSVVLNINGVSDTWSLTTKSSFNSAFEFVMRTTGANETITLPATGTNNFDVDWGDGSAIETVTTASPTHQYASAGDYEISITGTMPLFAFNNGGDRLKLISVSNLGDTGLAGNMFGAFRGCSSMTSFVCGDCDTSSITNVEYFFQGCSGATIIDVSALNISSVASLGRMFEGCTLVESLDLSSFDTALVTDLYGMFNGCQSLNSIDLSSFDTSAVATMTLMFGNCLALINLDVSSFSFAAATDLSYMFYDALLSAESYSRALITMANSVSANSGAYNVNASSQNGHEYNSTNYGGSPYNNAVAARAYLVGGTAGWTITNDSAV
jgi:surface protein